MAAGKWSKAKPTRPSKPKGSETWLVDKEQQNLGLTNGFYGDIVDANQKDVKPVTGMSTVSELPF